MGSDGIKGKMESGSRWLFPRAKKKMSGNDCDSRRWYNSSGLGWWWWSVTVLLWLEQEVKKLGNGVLKLPHAFIYGERRWKVMCDDGG
jgi:hypothetical protein